MGRNKKQTEPYCIKLTPSNVKKVDDFVKYQKGVRVFADRGHFIDCLIDRYFKEADNEQI